VRFSALLTLALAVLAGLAAAVPVSPALVERVYSMGVYPVLQRVVTSLSNLSPFALIDLLLVAGAAWFVVLIVTAVRMFRRGGARRVQRLVVMTVLPGAVLYLAFVGLWGFNYRRLPLESKLPFDAGAVTSTSARSLAETAVARLNALHDAAHAAGWDDIEPQLKPAFAAAEREAGAPGGTVPARPRSTLLDWYFRSAAVAGMTDPFFLETLVASDLLPFERPFVIAHEWSHLAGFADEGEANFLAWLTCLRGPVAAQYSGWISLYAEAIDSLPRRDRAAVTARLAAGPRQDLRALADRLARNVSPSVSTAGWRVYDRYLKANRVEDGAASYARVVRLALGTELGRRELNAASAGSRQ
jgi:hypothetical protein